MELLNPFISTAKQPSLNIQAQHTYIPVIQGHPALNQMLQCFMCICVKSENYALLVVVFSYCKIEAALARRETPVTSIWQ